MDGTSHISSLFVANVNVDGGKLKVNVNRFSNDNVWNAVNRHLVVVPQHIIFSPSLGEFLSPAPSATRPASDQLLAAVRLGQCTFVYQVRGFPTPSALEA